MWTHRIIAGLGRAVPPIGLGAMPLSLGRRPDEAEAVRIIHAAIDAGLGLIAE